MDTLSVKINLQAQEADRLMQQLNTKFNTADREVKGLSQSMDKFGRTKEDIRNVGTHVDRVTGKFKALSAVASTTGRGLRSAFNSTVTSMRTVLRVTGLVSAALGGLGAAKASSDFMKFSQMVGRTNATIRGTAEEVRAMEMEGLAISAITGGDPIEVQRGFNQLVSTTEFGFEQYKDAAGKIIDKVGYDLQKDTNRMIMENVGKVGTAYGETPYEQVMVTMGMAGALAMPMKGIKDVNKMLNMQVAIINTSKGEWAELGPQIERASPSMRAAGFTAEETLGIFSQLTTVASPDKAGMMLEALGRNMMRIPDTIKTVENAIDSSEIADKTGRFRSIFFDESGNFRKDIDKVSMVGEILKWIKEAKTEEEMLSRASLVLGEIREKRTVMIAGEPVFLEGIRAAIEQIKKTMSDPLAWENAWNASLLSIGQQWLLFKNQLTAASMATAGGLFTVLQGLLSGKKVDVSIYGEGIKVIGEEMDKIIPGSSIIAEQMRKFVDYVSSDKGIKKLREMGELIKNLALDLGKVAKAFMNIVESPMFDKLIKQVSENPVKSYLEYQTAKGIGGAALKALTGAFIVEKGIKWAGLTRAGAMGVGALAGAMPTVARAGTVTAEYANSFVGQLPAVEKLAKGGGWLKAIGTGLAVEGARLLGEYMGKEIVGTNKELLNYKNIKEEAKVRRMSIEQYGNFVKNRSTESLLGLVDYRNALNSKGIANKFSGGWGAAFSGLAQGANWLANTPEFLMGLGQIPFAGAAFNKTFGGTGKEVPGAREAQQMALELQKQTEIMEYKGAKFSPYLKEVFAQASSLQLTPTQFETAYREYGSPIGGKVGEEKQKGFWGKFGDVLVGLQRRRQGPITMMEQLTQGASNIEASAMNYLGNISSSLEFYFNNRAAIDVSIAEAVNSKLYTPVPLYATINVPVGGGEVQTVAAPGVSAVKGSKFKT